MVTVNGIERPNPTNVNPYDIRTVKRNLKIYKEKYEKSKWKK